MVDKRSLYLPFTWDTAIPKVLHLCHGILSAGLALAPIGAYLAVNDQLAVAPAPFLNIGFFLGKRFRYYLCLSGRGFRQIKSTTQHSGNAGYKKNTTTFCLRLSYLSIFYLGRHYALFGMAFPDGCLHFHWTLRLSAPDFQTE